MDTSLKTGLHKGSLRRTPIGSQSAKKSASLPNHITRPKYPTALHVLTSNIKQNIVRHEAKQITTDTKRTQPRVTVTEDDDEPPGSSFTLDALKGLLAQGTQTLDSNRSLNAYPTDRGFGPAYLPNENEYSSGYEPVPQMGGEDLENSVFGFLEDLSAQQDVEQPSAVYERNPAIVVSGGKVTILSAVKPYYYDPDIDS